MAGVMMISGEPVPNVHSMVDSSQSWYIISEGTFATVTSPSYNFPVRSKASHVISQHRSYFAMPYCHHT
jgi:hypothetical protein